MDTANYLNFKPLNQEMKIYRYIRLKRLYELFDDCKNVLVHPSKWEDPFENFILNSQLKYLDGTKSEDIGLRDRVYGQCWTTQSVSDAFWRIYCPKECGKIDGVRIRTSLKCLAQGFTNQIDQGEALHSFIGRVQYLTQPKLLKYANELFSSGVDPKKVASALLVKRRAFKHESEVRLVHRKLFGDPAPDRLFRYKIDPHSLINQIMIDPRLERDDALELIKSIKVRTGFKGKILRSLLYRKPDKLSFTAFTHYEDGSGRHLVASGD